MEKKYRITEFKYNGKVSDKAKNKNKIITNDSIMQPKFQRGLVWTNTKKKEFISTVLLGYPFGSILLYKSDNDEKYRVVDGLQRMNTLSEYSKNKFDFINYEYINYDLCFGLIRDYYMSVNRKNEIGNDDFNECVVKLQKALFSELKKKSDIPKICEKMYKNKDFVIKRGSNSVISKIVKDFESKTSIGNLDIPAIIYYGAYSDLPSIFYSLNVGGIKLSKYETFSSLWGDKIFNIDDDLIIETVKDKYEQLKKDSDFDVDIIDTDFEKGVTLFEYCCALSDIIKNNYTLLFGDKKKITDPAGFEMLTLLCGMSLGKEEDLYGKLCNADPKFLKGLKNITIEAFDKIQEILAPWIVAMNGAKNITSSTYMLYHMAMSYILNNYEINVEKFSVESLKGKSTLNLTENFEKYLPYHYIHDTLDEFWSKHRQVSQLKQLIDDDTNRYYYKIATNDWKETLDNFSKEQKNYKLNQFSFKTKIFIDYLVKCKISNEKLVKNQEEDKKYFKVIKDEKGKAIRTVDYEHIVTIESIQSKFKGKDIKQIIADEELPVYSLGNVCYLTSHINRSKRGKNIPDFEEKYPGLEISSKYKKLVNYPIDSKLEFVKYNKQQFIDGYKHFINKRVDELIEDFNTYVIDNIK